MSPGVGVSGANVTVVLDPGTEVFGAAPCPDVVVVTPLPLPLPPPPPHAASATDRVSPIPTMIPIRRRSGLANDAMVVFRVTRRGVRSRRCEDGENHGRYRGLLERQLSELAGAPVTSVSAGLDSRWPPTPGIRMVTRLPPSGRFAIDTVPPWPSTIACTIERPSPAPPSSRSRPSFGRDDRS